MGPVAGVVVTELFEAGAALFKTGAGVRQAGGVGRAGGGRD